MKPRGRLAPMQPRDRVFWAEWRALRQRFPDGEIVHRPVGGDVFITIPLSDGESFQAALSWEQAKYLAHSQLTADALKEGRLPPDWPK